ncbi:unnamed protein product [Strongylus vulgaris]|uniref:Uncharacterized protein n=1 Tax=Strongylus vulgaris TaxID=40348 RepID=A0A3P7J6I8_STRVU|nr:unnamed protein product [Strongylus vulgaris]
MNLALISGKGAPKKQRPSIRTCNMTDYINTQTLKTIFGECSDEDKQALTNWAECPVGGVSTALFVSSDMPRFCSRANCNDMAVIDDTKENAYFATLIEIYDERSNEQLLTDDCTFQMTKRSHLQSKPSIVDNVEYRTLSAYPRRGNAKYVT